MCLVLHVHISFASKKFVLQVFKEDYPHISSIHNIIFFENLPSSMCVFCIFVCMSVSHSLCVYAKVPVEALELEL